MSFHQLSFKVRVLSIVFLASAMCAFVAISGFIYFQSKSLEYGIINKERTILTQLSAATKFVAKQGGLKSVIDKMSKKYKSAEELSKSDIEEILNQVPIYSAMVMGKENASIDHYNFRIFSDEPRKKEYQATPQEMEIFNKFKNDPSLLEYSENDGSKITLYNPVRISKEQGCLHCHGNPAESPWNNGTDVLGYKMENWVDGKLHGVFSISQNIAEVKKASVEGHIITPDTLLIGGIVLGALIALFIGALFLQAPIKGLQNIVSVLENASERVDGTSKEASQSAVTLSESATEQAAALQETSASLEEITAMIAKSSEGADSTASSAMSTQDKAENGKQAVGDMLTSMDQIKSSNDTIMEQINNSNKRFQEIVDIIRAIDDKTKVINEIVFQTKLLSFNASVEAARAGEYGKGFSVVAEEIGSLAHMSGVAAKEITELLNISTVKVDEIIKETSHKIDSLITNGQERVSEGVSVAHQCAQSLNEIVEHVQNVTTLSQEIATANKEQTQGVGEINKALNQMNMVTQENTVASHTVASAAEKLADQANDLKGVVRDLIRIINGEVSNAQDREDERSEQSISDSSDPQNHINQKAS